MLEQKPVVAIFDFDGTLTNRHTFWRFLRLAVGGARFSYVAIRLFPSIAKLAFGRMPLLEAREKLIFQCLKGFPERELSQLGESFAAASIPAWLRPEGMQCLRWHQDQHHKTILVSNSAEYYLRPWGESVGFDEVFGSQFEARSGVLTGHLHGTHCQGEEKVSKIKSALGDLSQYCLYAYGDSSGDEQMLAIANRPNYRTFAGCCKTK